MKVVIVGCGWLGAQLAISLMQESFDVIATRRSLSALDKLPAGVTSGVLALGQSVVDARWTDYLHNAVVVCAIPPGRQDNNLYLASLEQLANLAINAGARQIIHLSSTGIYQDCAGKIDENTDINFAHPRVALLRAGEQLLQQFPSTLTLRVAGLMGAGRHPAKFLSHGLLSDPAAPINMVHALDVIGAIKVAIANHPCSGTFNLSCPQFQSRYDFYLAALGETVFRQLQLTGLDVGRQVLSNNFIKIFNYQFRFSVASSALAYCN